MDGYLLTPPVAGRFSAGVQVSPPTRSLPEGPPPRVGNLASLITEICQTNYRGELVRDPAANERRRTTPWVTNSSLPASSLPSSTRKRSIVIGEVDKTSSETHTPPATLPARPDRQARR